MAVYYVLRTEQMKLSKKVNRGIKMNFYGMEEIALNKRFWKKCLTGILCTVLFFTNVLSTEILAFATETETDSAIVEKDSTEESTKEESEEQRNADSENETEKEKDDIENKEEESEIDQKEDTDAIEEEEKDPTEESAKEEGEEQENADSENETEKEKHDIENEEKESEIDQEENTDVIEEDKEDTTDDLTSEDAENQNELVMASDDIASGTSNYTDDENITWRINADGKLIVEGTGMYLTGGVAHWETYKQYITSAEINVTGAIRASNMFSGCANLVNVDLSNFDTSQVTNMDDMFAGCYSLTDIDLDNFNTGKVTSMRNMFANCNSLIDLDLSSFDTSNVIYMDGMFEGCSNLVNLDLSSFNTNSVTYMYHMFTMCKSLISLDLSNFCVSGSEHGLGLAALFQGCDSLTSLDLSNFDLNKESGMYAMLDCEKLTTIYTPLNVNETVVLPTKEGDKWYKSDGREVTELPQNLSYSIELGKNYIPEEDDTEIDMDDETIIKIEIASNISISKDKSGIQVIDGKTGEPITGARVWVDGEYWTGDNGVIELTKTGLTTIQVEKDGYHDKKAKKKLEKGKVMTVVLCPDTGSVQILSASLNLTGEDEDVLNNTVYLTHGNLSQVDGGVDATFTLTVESSGKAEKYELIQNGKIIQESSTGIFELPGKYINEGNGDMTFYTDKLSAGYRVSVRVCGIEDSKAREGGGGGGGSGFGSTKVARTRELGIRVSEGSHLIQQIKREDSKFTVGFGGEDGKKLKVTIPGNIPLVGNSELEFGFEKKIPVIVTVDEKNKVKIALNCRPFDTSNSAEWSNIKREYNSLANKAVNALDAAAAFGGSPQSFGAGLVSFDGNITGYGEGYLDDSTDSLCVNVGAIIKVGGEGKYTQYFFVVVPFYLNFGLGVSLTYKGELSATINENGLVFGGSGDIEPSTYGRIEGGVGADGLLSIGAYGKVTYTWLRRLSNNYNRVTLNGNAKIKATALVWSKVLAELDGTWTIYDENGSTNLARLLNESKADYMNMSNAELISMDYLSRRADNTGVSVFAFNRAGNSGTTRFMSYAYENASPRLVRVGSKLYLFYLDGVEGRSAQNQTALFYQSSTDNGTTWTDAVRVDNKANETADYDFDVAVNGNNIYVIWSDAGKVYGNEILSMDSEKAIATVGKEMDLMLAVINSNTGAIKTSSIATEDADMKPHIAVGNDGSVYVAWIMNDVVLADGLLSNENQLGICYASSTDNYKVHSIPLTKGYYPLTLDVGNVGAETCIALDIDIDGSLDTQEDREIYTLNLDGGDNLISLTSNDIVDSVPLFGKIGGNSCLFWYQGGNIAYTADKQNISFVFEDSDIPPIGQEFSLIEGNNGNASIVWTATSLTEEAGVDLYCTDFDGSSWSSAYMLDEMESEYTAPVSGYLDGSDYKMTYLGSTYEGDELYSHIYLCTPEERIDTSVTLSAERDGVQGEEYPLHLTVTNNGNVPVSSLTISSADGSIQETITGLSIAPGAMYDFTWNGIILPSGMTEVYTCNLTVKASGEADTDGNVFDLTVGEPDFSMETYLDYSNGDQFAGIVVSNNGILSSDVVLTIYKDENHTSQLYQTTLSGIAGGESKLAIFDLTALDRKSPVFYFTITDTNGMEIYTGDNEAVLYSGKGTYLEDDNPGDDNPGDNDNPGGDDNTGGNDNPGGNNNSGSGDSSENDRPGYNGEATDAEWNISNRVDLSEGIGTGTNIETWKPTTPDEKKRYACVGSEAVQYTLDKDNPYRLIIEKAMQGPLCFDSFEAVLGDYTIGRTYNIYIYPNKVYSSDKEVQFTIKIPKAIYKPGRDYKMICVTKNGLPIVYEDLDKNPETITVRTNKFYAYALIYKDMM